MRLLADENFPRSAVLHLRSCGHDVKWVRNIRPGAPDTTVLEMAVSEDRILLTLDKDFGELVFNRRIPTPKGIILFRLPPSAPPQFAGLAATVISNRTDWEGQFSVIEKDKIRMTTLPQR